RGYIRRIAPVQGEDIKNAIRYYRSNVNPSQRETCAAFGLTRSVFQKYLKINPCGIPNECSQRRHAVFTKDMEEEILSYIHMLANRFYAITRQSLAELASRVNLAVRHHLEHPFIDGRAGDGWVTSFLERHCHELSLRTVSAKNYDAGAIFNMDETGVSLVPIKPPKRIVRRGVRSVPVMVPAERATIDVPVLLILDNHSSHVSFQAVSYCRRHHINLLTSPPHTTHKLQPCDVSFFGPLKNKYSQYLVRWLSERPGCIWHFNTFIHVWGLNRHVYDEEFSDQSDEAGNSSGNDDNEPTPLPPDSPLRSQRNEEQFGSNESSCETALEQSNLISPSSEPPLDQPFELLPNHPDGPLPDQPLGSDMDPPNGPPMDQPLELQDFPDKTGLNIVPGFATDSQDGFASSSLPLSKIFEDTEHDYLSHINMWCMIEPPRYPQPSALSAMLDTLSTNLPAPEQYQTESLIPVPLNLNFDFEPCQKKATEPQTNQLGGPPLDQPPGFHTDPPGGPPSDQPPRLDTDSLLYHSDQPSGFQTDLPGGPPFDQPPGFHTDPPGGLPCDQSSGYYTKHSDDEFCTHGLFGVSRRAESEILTGRDEALNNNDNIDLIVPRGSVKRTFTVGPQEVGSSFKFPEICLVEPSKRKPRECQKAELVTSNENMSKLSQKQARKKATTSEESSDERKKTCSISQAEKVILRSGKRVK
ncbi:unnamed protein product, partial [Allacma fusca]